MTRRRPTCGVAIAPALALLVLFGTGCASAGQSWRAGPAGIPAERAIRAQLTGAQYETALASLKKKEIAPADALLRHMYKGVVALQAGDTETGARAMDRAWDLSYQRWTKRLGDAAAAMVTGDGALPYTPGPAERMFIPYYGALAWFARNEMDDAAVEARRLGTLLQGDGGPRPPDDFRAGMRYIAGVMFEVAGERNDAEVSYRNASAILGGALPLDTLPPDAQHGDVVILIEDGFVQRPEPASTEFWYTDDDLRELDGKDYDARIRAANRVEYRRHQGRDWRAEKYRSVTLNWPVMGWGPSPDRERGVVGARAFVAPQVAMGSEATPTDAPVSYQVGFDEVATVLDGTVLSMSVSDAVRADFERRQPARLARAIARAALRDAAFKEAEKAFDRVGDDDDDDKDKKDSKAKAVGNILLGIGLLAAGASSAVLDQPDLRAWQVLPDRVTIVRLRLPVGDHPIEVTRAGEAVSLGVVTVKPGAVTLMRHRFWPRAGRSVAHAP